MLKLAKIIFHFLKNRTEPNRHYPRANRTEPNRPLSEGDRTEPNRTVHYPRANRTEPNRRTLRFERRTAVRSVRRFEPTVLTVRRFYKARILWCLIRAVETNEVYFTKIILIFWLTEPEPNRTEPNRTEPEPNRTERRFGSGSVRFEPIVGSNRRFRYWQHSK